MKQTAVEWLVEQLENHYVKQDLKNTTVYKQAKEMEKQQIIDAVDGHPLFARPFEGVDYYDEVYKK